MVLEAKIIDIKDGGKEFFDLRKFIRQNKIISLLLFLSFLLIMIGVLLLVRITSQDDQAVQIIPAEESDSGQAQGVYVDLGGAVQKPGLYHLPSESRVNDLLIAAGGLSAEANREYVDKTINLSQKLKDGIKIYIPSQSESGKTEDGNVVGVATSGAININLASQQELESLPGIGPVTAQQIITYRTENGLFEQTEDIKKVSGIGDKTYDQIKELISTY